MKGYNITQLNPDMTFERHIYHRDQFAHFLRWSHVLKIAKIGMNILDIGCGSGNLYEVFYRNRYSPNHFLGIDVRKQTIEKNKQKFPKAEWLVLDPVKESLPENNWDIIASFEVAEHIGKQNVPVFLDNIKKVMNKKTVFLISTPCYNEKVGAAENHIYDSGDGQGKTSQELTYQEMQKLLSERFEIIEKYGTFASQKDYINQHQFQSNKDIFDQLSSYYDTNLLAVIFAPLVPEYSRNVIWKCKI